MRLHANYVALNGWMPFDRLACVCGHANARTPMADRGSEPDEEDGELGPRGASLGCDHVERLRVP